MLQFLTLSLFEFYNCTRSDIIQIFNVIPLKHIITCSQLSQASRRWIFQNTKKVLLQNLFATISFKAKIELLSKPINDFEFYY